MNRRISMWLEISPDLQELLEALADSAAMAVERAGVAGRPASALGDDWGFGRGVSGSQGPR